jgi:hypothetical protein
LEAGVIDKAMIEEVLNREIGVEEKEMDMVAMHECARELRRMRRIVGTRKGSSRVNDIYVGLRTGILLGRLEAARDAGE